MPCYPTEHLPACLPAWFPRSRVGRRRWHVRIGGGVFGAYFLTTTRVFGLALALCQRCLSVEPEGKKEHEAILTRRTRNHFGMNVLKILNLESWSPVLARERRSAGWLRRLTTYR